LRRCWASGVRSSAAVTVGAPVPGPCNEPSAAAELGWHPGPRVRSAGCESGCCSRIGPRWTALLRATQTAAVRGQGRVAALAGRELRERDPARAHGADLNRTSRPTSPDSLPLREHIPHIPYETFRNLGSSRGKRLQSFPPNLTSRYELNRTARPFICSSANFFVPESTTNRRSPVSETATRANLER
jgi:hypothetical protein